MHTSGMSNVPAAETPPQKRSVLRTTTATEWKKTVQRYVPDEHAALVTGATASNMSINDYVRAAVLEKLAREGHWDES